MYHQDTPRDVTCVAFYGPKPQPLRELIEQCTRVLCKELGDRFTPYDVNQVHATFIGLEADPEAPTLHNLNFRRRRYTRVRMDVPAFRHSLLESKSFPLTVQIGGFADRDYCFTSRGARPFMRSFSIQGDKAVVMGWPVTPAQPTSYPTTLDDLRKSAQKFGVLHDYHSRPNDVDNDFYFRIGLVDPVPDDRTREHVERLVRDILASKTILLEVSAFVLFLASYSDMTLPLADTQVFSLTDPGLADSDIASLYTDI